MSTYSKLWQRIWTDSDFTALSIAAQQMYLLLVSSPDRNNAGVLPLTIRRWSNYSADATPDSVRSALSELVGRDFIVVDWDTEEVLVRTYIRNDGGYKTPTVAQSVSRSVEATESPTLRNVLRKELERLMIDSDERVKEQFSSVIATLCETLSHRVSDSVSETLSDSVSVEISKDVVVGTYLSGMEPTFNHNLQPAPAAPGGAAARAHASDALNAASALVSQIVPKQHPRKVVTGLRDQACELLADGTEPDLVAAALKLWLDRGISAPSILPSLVSDAIKLRAPRNGARGASRKINEWTDVYNRINNQPNIIEGEIE